MTSLAPQNIPHLLREYGLHPSKRLGQNFLVDEHALQQIVSIAEITSEDSVLEIGPGLGSLTRHLALAAHSVTAVELDSTLFPALQAVLASFTNIVLLQGDILKLDPAALMEASHYLVVANIPYYITSAVIRHLLECPRRPRRIVLTVQQEVADRICALPGDMSLLALSVQVYGQPQIKANIPAGSFYPPPKVDSAVLSVDIFPQPVIPTSILDVFFVLAKAGFSQKRKTLRNSLSAGLRLPPAVVAERLLAAEIDPQRRAETLNLSEWERLSRLFSSSQDQ